MGARVKKKQAAHGRAAGQGQAGQDGTLTGRFAQETTDPLAFQGIEDNCPELVFGGTNRRNPSEADGPA